MGQFWSGFGLRDYTCYIFLYPPLQSIRTEKKVLLQEVKHSVHSVFFPSSFLISSSCLRFLRFQPFCTAFSLVVIGKAGLGLLGYRCINSYVLHLSKYYQQKMLSSSTRRSYRFESWLQFIIISFSVYM